MILSNFYEINFSIFPEPISQKNILNFQYNFFKIFLK